MYVYIVYINIIYIYMCIYIYIYIYTAWRTKSNKVIKSSSFNDNFEFFSYHQSFCLLTLASKVNRVGRFIFSKPCIYTVWDTCSSINWQPFWLFSFKNLKDIEIQYLRKLREGSVINLWWRSLAKIFCGFSG